MPAINFQAQWSAAVYIGAQHANGRPCTADLVPKRTTIRKPGRAKPGQTLYLYTGQRTAACRKLGEVLCLAVTPVRFLGDLDIISLGNQILTREQFEAFARLDTAGLWGWDDFARFFAETYDDQRDFELISW